MNKTSALFAALALAAAFAAFLLAKPGGGRAPADPAVAAGRPAATYRPKAEPLRRAQRPALAPAPVPAADGAEEDEDDLPEDEAEAVAGATAPPPPDLREDDPALAALEPERLFAESVWNALSAGDDLVREGAGRLDSPDPAERALGGVLLFFGDVLEGDVLRAVVSDPDLRVPLAVFDWVRDNGTDEQIASFRSALAGRGAESGEYLAVAAESAGLPGGGRSALDLFLAGFAEDDVPVEALARLVASPDASYDVRQQALFKLLEPATRPAGEAALRTFSRGVSTEDGGLVPFAAGKMAALAEVSNPDGDDEKIWDSEAGVVFFLAQTEGGLQARDLANYLEYALRRDDPEYPPIIEEGTWEFANEFLLAAQERIGDFPPVELDALDRIAVSLDRLVEYDPAFNPFETVEDDGDDDDEAGDADDEEGAADDDEDEPEPDDEDEPEPEDGDEGEPEPEDGDEGEPEPARRNLERMDRSK